MEAVITTLTFVTVAVVVYGLVNRKGYGRALALGGATPVGATLVVGGVALPTFYAVALGAVAGVALRLLRRPRDGPVGVLRPVPGSLQLVLLIVVAVLVTLVAPLLFSGLPVLDPTGTNTQLTAGVVTKSNIAQMIYLVLSVSVVAYLARSPSTGPALVGTACCLATLLSFWSWANVSYGVPFPAGFFDNSPTFAYIETLPGGAPRVRGIFSEPSGLASSCLVTLAYCSSRFRQVTGPRRLGVASMAAVALFLGAISTSTTFIVAGLGLAVLAMVVGAVPFVLRSTSLSRSALTAVCGLALASLWVLPSVANAIGQQLTDKISSTSYVDRSSADDASYRLLLDTFGIGSGLGANRASSFAASLLSTVGIVGALLFATAVVLLVRRSWSSLAARPAAWALAAVLMSKLIAGPDLSDSSGLLWLSLGVLAHAASDRPRGAQPPTGVLRDHRSTGDEPPPSRGPAAVASAGGLRMLATPGGGSPRRDGPAHRLGPP